MERVSRREWRRGIDFTPLPSFGKTQSVCSFNSFLPLRCSFFHDLLTMIPWRYDIVGIRISLFPEEKTNSVWVGPRDTVVSWRHDYLCQTTILGRPSSPLINGDSSTWAGDSLGDCNGRIDDGDISTTHPGVLGPWEGVRGEGRERGSMEWETIQKGLVVGKF